MLDTHSPVPLYYQLEKVLEGKINSGEYQPGEQIPSENQLCKLYSISRTTVRQAINEMVNNGQLVRTQGRGTFVADLRIIKSASRLSGFTKDMKELGHKPKTRILEFTPIIPPAYVQNALNLGKNEVTILIKRIRYNGDDVLGLDTSYFPFKRFETLLNEDLENNSTYKILDTKYNTIPSRSKYDIEVRRCPRELAGLLELSVADYVLFIREIFFDQNDNIFQYGEEYYRVDRYSIQVEINHFEEESIRGIPSLEN